MIRFSSCSHSVRFKGSNPHPRVRAARAAVNSVNGFNSLERSVNTIMLVSVFVLPKSFDLGK